jgi:hypothetical protein
MRFLTGFCGIERDLTNKHGDLMEYNGDMMETE